MGTGVTMIRRFARHGGKGEWERTRTRRSFSSRRNALAARDRLISLNCVELRGIIFSILGKRQLNQADRTGPDGDMQRTPGSHTKPHKSRRGDTHGIQGVSDRRFMPKWRKKFELADLSDLIVAKYKGRLKRLLTAD